MLSHVQDMLAEMEADASIADRDQAFGGLRRLGLEDFSDVLIHMPMAEYPKLSQLLPRMASEEVQNGWTGASGQALLIQSLAFVRSMMLNFAQVNMKSLKDVRILDFGCGYGRLARTMYYFFDTDQVFGVDPWDRSIEECHKAGLRENFRQSTVLPDTLPIENERFDIVYAFSVYTHLSERTFKTTVRTIRRYMNKNGLLCITIRPIEIWDADQQITAQTRADLQRQHRETGFAFDPIGFAAPDGEMTYGNTSMTLDWVKTNMPDWTIVAIDRSLSDSLQLYVFLRLD